MSDAPVFVDTNVLVYRSRPSAPDHERSRVALGELRTRGVPLWLSRQVLREFLAVVTRPQSSGPALPMQAAVDYVRTVADAFNIAEDSPAAFDRLLGLLVGHPGGGKQVHDANLVATMLGHSVTRLLTFNARDFRRFEPLIEVIEP